MDHLRGEEEPARLLLGTLEAGERLLVSEATRFELLAGARKGEQGDLDQLFRALEWVLIDEVVSVRAGELARAFRDSHLGVDAIDYLIAATAELADAELWTLNVRHFPMFEGLRAPY